MSVEPPPIPEPMPDMRNLKIAYVETPVYATRIRGVLIPALVIPVAMGVFSLIFVELIGLFVSLATLSIIQALNQTGRSKYFITRYELQGEQVVIDYTRMGKPLTVTDPVTKFSAKKRAVLFQRGTEAYLAIYHNGKLLVKQYQGGGWHESAFDSVVVSLGGKVTSGMLLEL